MQTKKKVLSFLLSVIIGVAMLVALPLPAYAAELDLEFGLSGSSSDISKTYVFGIWNSQSDTVFSCQGDGTVLADLLSESCQGDGTVLTDLLSGNGPPDNRSP